MKKIIWILSLCFICSNFLVAQDVYPGDVDNNGIVDHLDLLYIGVANEATGPPRVVQGDFWQPYAVTNWGVTFPGTGIDYAYADCNGDGIINFQDYFILQNNFGLEHGTVTPAVFIEGTPGVDVELHFDSIGFFNPFFQTEFVVVGISLGTPAVPANDFYGISFTIEYDPTVFCQGICMLGFNTNVDSNIDPNGNLFFEHTAYKNNDPSLGEIVVTIVKNDQTPSTGFGSLGTYAGIIEDNVVDLYGSSGELNTELKIKDIRTITNNFTELPTVSDSIEVLVIDPDSLLSSTENLESGIKIFPNPVSEIINIESLNNPILQFHILDLQGRSVYYSSNLENFNRAYLNVADYPEGVYFVKLLTEKGNVVKKITVLRE